MSWEEVTIGTCRLMRGDAREGADRLAAQALISDPPYGIGFNYAQPRTGRKKGLLKSSRLHGDHWQANVIGDTAVFDPAPWLRFPQIILWGAHLYAHRLPPSSAWLIWDKREGSTPDNHGDCELAWTNLPGVTRMHRQLWRGLVRSGEENATHGGKLHPCQKPIALMRWCVEKTTGVVLDPYAGSFTTAVACVQLGRPCVAIEIDPQYFDLGCRRVEAAYAQLSLFAPVPPTPAPPQQRALFTGV